MQTQELLRLLKPALRDQTKAERILKRYWKSRIALVWTVRDVHTAANERDRTLTNAEAEKLLSEMLKHYNPQNGLQWSDFTSYIDEYQLGRKMTRKEIRRFVKLNKLTIQR